MNLDFRRLLIEDNLFHALLVAESSLDNFADGLHPFLHGFAIDGVEKGGQFVQQVVVLFEIVEMLVDPMLENVEDSKLDRMRVFFSKPFHILSNPHLIKINMS